jgi:hypothetical protein
MDSRISGAQRLAPGSALQLSFRAVVWPSGCGVFRSLQLADHAFETHGAGDVFARRDVLLAKPCEEDLAESIPASVVGDPNLAALVLHPIRVGDPPPGTPFANFSPPRSSSTSPSFQAAPSSVESCAVRLIFTGSAADTAARGEISRAVIRGRRVFHGVRSVHRAQHGWEGED